MLSGLLTEAGWRWTLLVPAPVAAAILAAGIRLIARDPEPAAGRAPERHGYDIFGAVTSTTSVLVLVFGIVRAPSVGWGSAATLATFAAAVVLAVSFVVGEQRVPNPLVRLGVLRSPSLIRVLIGGGLMFGGYASFQFVVTQYLQSLSGWSALHTAMAFLPAGLVVLVSSFKIANVLDRFGTARTGVAGFAALSAGYLLFLRIGATPSSGRDPAVDPAVGHRLRAGLPGGQRAGGLRHRRRGAGPGVRTAEHQPPDRLTLVLAVSTAVMAANGGTTAHTHAQVLASYRPVLVFVAAVTLAGLAILAFGLLPGRRTPVEVDAGGGAAGPVGGRARGADAARPDARRATERPVAAAVGRRGGDSGRGRGRRETTVSATA